MYSGINNFYIEYTTVADLDLSEKLKILILNCLHFFW